MRDRRALSRSFNSFRRSLTTLTSCSDPVTSASSDSLTNCDSRSFSRVTDDCWLTTTTSDDYVHRHTTMFQTVINKCGQDKLTTQLDSSDSNWDIITLHSMPHSTNAFFLSYFLLIEAFATHNEKDENNTIIERRCNICNRKSDGGALPPLTQPLENINCTEQVFTLRNIIEQSLEHQQDLIINFIDFKKAFDSVHRPSLWKILKHYGIPDRFINIFKALYINSSCCVKIGSRYKSS